MIEKYAKYSANTQMTSYFFQDLCSSKSSKEDINGASNVRHKLQIDYLKLPFHVLNICMFIRLFFLFSHFIINFDRHMDSGILVSHPVLRPKPDAHRMYAQNQVVIHMTRM
jgi:hypothetical protein